MLIAQISDLHINPGGQPAYDKADTLRNLEKTLASLKSFCPDLVIISGDIADNGHEEAYLLCKSLLDKTGLPYFPIPGNHDHKPTMARVFHDQTALTSAFQQSDGRHLCYVIKQSPLLLIAMDTVFESEHGGGLDEERLGWLTKTLSAHAEKPTCIFMHYPPFLSGIPHMDKEPFKNREIFAALISQHTQIRRICCGHVHRPVTRALGHAIATICPSVGMQIPLDFRADAPSAFNQELPAFMLHYYAKNWDNEPELLTHMTSVELVPGQFEVRFPFF